MEKDETILIGIGEIEDPLPEEKKTTKYWIFAGPCEKCGSGGREINIVGQSVCLVCEVCSKVHNVGLEAREFFGISYVYWCNRSKFSSDRLELGAEDSKKIEALAKELEGYEMPRWAVVIVGGVCKKTSDCINFNCLYNAKKT